MQFILLIYHGPTPTLPGSNPWKALPESEVKAIYADYAEINKTQGVTPGYPLGLPNAARTVQVQDGKVHVKDGPYLAECVGGSFLFEAENVEAAIELAAKVPAARLGGAIEIRPVEKYW
jgi:hypothetical protein